ncbi:hypothetical protein G6Z12_14945 [Clostridium perfringens]|uniref:hypothetical protein n=1 Tax=Clostridium perfringens TaxID=1502 RepID=UPI0013E2AEB1|nr:hypothetical protein [Clostridium perfringens]NGT53202.1 hypothetical protein [Clostridium perfringens]
MNGIEREIYDKYAYDKTFKYIWWVYSEFERRVNNTLNEFEGLKRGECRFDYSSWEKRLDLSHWQMNKAIKTLIKDEYIEQRIKGKKGTQSTYFLTRFNLEFDQQKNQQNHQHKDKQNKLSNINRLKEINQQKEQQKNKQKTVQSSIYNNLNIKSNNIYSSKDVEEIWRLYPLKQGKANAIKKIPKLLKQYGKEQIIRCIDRYIQYVDNQRKNGFSELKYKNGSTFFNTGYVDYLDCNYQEDIIAKPKEEPRRRQTNLDDL